MSDSNSQKKNDYDLRTVAWYINKGRIEHEDYMKYLKHLPDLESKAVEISVNQKEFFGEREKK